MEKSYLSFVKAALLFSLFLFLLPSYLSACDGSGFVVNGITDNNDGTFTLDVTIHVAGANHPGGIFGGTRGFFFSTNAPGGIVSVTPASLTSINGTTLNAMIAGGQVNWGDPASGPFFVDASEPTQLFNIQVTVQGEPSSWQGGGQELNNCSTASNNGSGPEYSGCFPPAIQILPVGPVCAGQPLTVTALVSGGNVNVSWSNGMFGEAITFTPTGNIVLVATANNGCDPAQASINIMVDPLPTVDPLMDITVCQGEPVLLNAVTQNADDIFWSNGTVGNPNIFDAFFSETIIVTAMNQCGSVDQSMELTVIPDPEIFVIEGDETICAGEEVLLEVEAMNAETFMWSSGQPFQAIFITPTETTTYTATATNQCGEDEVDILVTVNPLPQIDIPLSTYQICEGEQADITALGIDAEMVSWDNGSMGETITVMPVTTTTFTATASNGCGMESGEVLVEVNPLPAIQPASNDTLICEGDSVMLSVQVENEDMFSWSEGSTSTDITVSPGANTTYTATAANLCGEVSASIDVDIQESPSFMVTESTASICEGEMATLAISPEFADSILWSNGIVNDSSITVSPIQDTSFMVTVSNFCGTVDSTFDIAVIELPEVALVDSGMDICEGESTSLEVTLSNEDTFSWSNGELDTDISVSPDVTTTYTATATNICGSDEESVTINVFEVYSENQEFSACTGDTVFYLGTPILPGGAQTFDLSSVNGCDSTINVSVTELPVYEEDLMLQACTGTSVMYDGTELFPGDMQSFTLSTVAGCDSVINVMVEELLDSESEVGLQACTGTTVDYNGTTLDPGDIQDFTFSAFNGCDSVVTVTVEELSTFASSLSFQACTGTTIDYIGNTLNPGDSTDFIFAALNGCDSTVTVVVEELPVFASDQAFDACPGTSVTYEGEEVMAGTSQSFTLSALNGCDSVVNVTVNELPTFASTLTLQACTGTTADYQGSSLNPGEVADFTFAALNGCDSVVTVTVEELLPVQTTVFLEACTGSTADYLGNALNPGDTTDFTFSALNTCDSVVTVIVEELPVFESSLDLEACTGTTVDYNGTTLDPGAEQSFVLSALNGCDSTVNVTVIELSTFESDLMLQACTGFTATYEGVELNPGDEQDFTLAAMNGCDSVVHVTVEEVTVLESDLTLRTCPDTPVQYDGMDLNVGDVEDFTFTSQTGCDSIVTVTVMPYATFDEVVNLQACTGTTVTYNNQELNPGETVDFAFNTINGCDSLVQVVVEELEIFELPLSLESCPGTPVTYNGVDLLPGEQQSFTFTAANGCDSTMNVSVVALPIFESDLALQTCIGTTTIYNGVELAPGDEQSFTLVATNGCDSTVNVSVEGIDIFETDVALDACTGTTVDYNGTTLDPGDVQTFTFTSQIGCDSFVTVSVEELPLFESDLTLEICDGSTIIYEGVELSPDDQQDFILSAANGCDSTVSVSVVGLEILTTSESRTICDGDSSIIFGETQFTAGAYSETFTSFYGCDSIHTVNLSVSPLPALQSDVQMACPEEENGTATISASNGQSPYSYLWEDGNATASREDLGLGNYVVTVTDALGCQQQVEVLVEERMLEYSSAPQNISCFGAGDGLVQLIAEGAGLTYSLDGENFTSSSTFTGLQAGSYTATIQDAFGCRYEEGGIIVEEPEELIVVLPEDETIEVGDSIFINTLTNGGDDLTYNWAPLNILNCTDCARPYARPFETTYLTVAVRDSNNCTAEDRMLIIVERNRNVYIPNIFSPNNDGVNDIFFINTDQSVVQIKTFYIFNRWGESVFEIFSVQPNNPLFGWDGTYRGELMNGAVFTYFAELEFVDGEVVLFKGDVTLMR
jgi:gliding motility-associated-like protein